MSNINIYRTISFFIDIAIVRIITLFLFGFGILNDSMEVVVFISLYGIYYIGSYFWYGKTVGNFFFNLNFVYMYSKKYRFFRICTKYFLTLPILLCFLDIHLTINLSEGVYKDIKGYIPIIYLLYFIITNSYLHDRLTKTTLGIEI